MAWRWLSGSFDGTCQARPQAGGSVPATTSIRATSSVDDQVCGRSARAEHRDALALADPPDDPFAQRALRAGADEIGGADLGTRARPAWCAASASCQTRARTRPLGPVVATGVARSSGAPRRRAGGPRIPPPGRSRTGSRR